MSAIRRTLAGVASVLAILVTCPGATAQCMRWDGVPIYTYALDLTVFDDGSGPALYAGTGASVLRWDGNTWTMLGDEFSDEVSSVCGYDSGIDSSIYAGGTFTSMYWTGQVMWHIVKLNGPVYSNVGGGLPTLDQFARVNAMKVFDDGSGSKLYVAGGFNAFSTLNSDNIVRWDGVSWSGVGGGLVGGVGALCIFDDGAGPQLYASTSFTVSGGGYVTAILCWDGAAWSTVANPILLSGLAVGPGVGAMTVYDDGTGPALFVGGQFNSINGVAANGLAKWDGLNWTAVPGVPLGPPTYCTVRALTVHDDGSGPALYASGLSSLAYQGQVARWDGTNWSSVGGGPSSFVYSLQPYDGGPAGLALYAAGDFSIVGGNVPSMGVGRWFGGCSNSIDPLCFGDGTFAACPCGNYGTLGHGCGNSASTAGALLSASGSTNPDTLVLSSSSEPTTSTSLFLQSDALAPDYSVLGDGLRCLGGQLHRMYVKSAVGGTAQAPQAGDPSITQRSATLGDPIQTGSVRFYQVWYRDNASYCTSPRHNISNGLRVVW